ncbi:site-2 protease family protein [Candidatus Shapirobacteria bacterium CG03_land_8_20_14_0_80_40_19]|uniref:Site-2 protease family protein n=4 Tax=Candidatus Shapironibacteriota TaxID=1752721 RepID=A0A2M7BAU4_9BACT|nr:MAG: site-2 protease family protein [Candidatus Shapirobacteria bacterium CG11_big_fil_rev_8_21_14_0_20_40_12]PIV00202.1 MAG: site-2 protease family protein [Candidatus Shapirobacteria bacterium CG03_land_8_20_14_0_80_40_19]PJC28519.1 MAG: site-2 protease family protein [Candidatus Shapirobacteria bacterium CG_4_9_14_0_2_um_filter_40_11]PJC76135.1 MAG: site-2 protease family protein [Candidatus Shapirobacteria bacterium CG_4_8_14_3_um_filter_39_11]
MINIVGFIIFIFSIIIHEIAHGLMAEKLGDPTARLSKRLTLNPLPHIDPVMSIIFPLLLIFSGSPVIFGAAKPVPIDPYNLRNPRKDMGLIGLAGPLSNLILAVVLSLIARISLPLIQYSFLFGILQYGTQINIMLAIFNLIPLPPLDGGRIAVALLPEKYADALASLERFGILIILFLLLFPTSLFSLPNFIYKITNLLFSLVFPNFSLI